jgi:hypothetical protein
MSVALFLRSINLEEECGAVFEKEKITMDVLVEMRAEDLQAIGILSFGVRHKILRSIEKLTVGQPGRGRESREDSLSSGLFHAGLSEHPGWLSRHGAITPRRESCGI